MKQNITEKQLSELSKEHYLKLCDWANECFPKGLQFMLESSDKTLSRYMTIGRMIEFLDEHREEPFKWWNDLFKWDYGSVDGYELDHEEFCDALWEAIKKLLETK